MLKIKDNVDLKELEKFGFGTTTDYHGNTLYVHYSNGHELLISVPKGYITLKVDADSGGWDYISDEQMEKIFDLIQAGLVEKVGD